jgi:hypothetical protein
VRNLGHFSKGNFADFRRRRYFSGSEICDGIIEHMARIWETRNEYIILMGKAFEKRQLKRQRRELENKMNMEFRQAVLECMSWIKLDEDVNGGLC